METYKRKLLLSSIIVLVVLYLFTQHFCSGDCYLALERPLFGPLYYLSIGLVPSVIFLQFFVNGVAKSWVRNIAWWYLILAFAVVSTVKYGQGLFPMTSDGRSDTAILMMVILFVITLVYAPLMHKKLRS